MNSESKPQFEDPEIEDLENKMRMGLVRMVNGKLTEVSEEKNAAEYAERKGQITEKNIEVDPELQKEESLHTKLANAEANLSDAQDSLQRATDFTGNATLHGREEDPSKASEDKIKIKAARVRESFEILGAIQEAKSALDEAGSLKAASELLSSKEEAMNEKIRHKSTERGTAYERGDAAGAKVLDNEREELIAMREKVTKANQELKNL